MGLTEAQVNEWLALFIERLRERFGERLVYVGQHGSWTRGEARPDSDIDAFVVIDKTDEEALAAYAEIIGTMPDVAPVSAFMGSVEELRVWPRLELCEVFYACSPLYGSLEGVVEEPASADFLEHARYTTAQVMFELRHYLLHPHEPTVYVHRLRHRFKWAFFALQSWAFVEHGRYVSRLGDLLEIVPTPDDREVLRVVCDWHLLEDDRNARPLYYMQLLERWSRGMMARIGERERRLPPSETPDRESAA